MPQLQDGDWEDADEVIRDWYQQQKELGSAKKDEARQPKTYRISKAIEMTVFEDLPERLVRTVMPEMNYAPDEDRASSSQYTTNSGASSPRRDDIPSSSPARKLPSFYDEFNKEFLTRILHAVTFFLREEEFKRDDCYESKKDYYYNLLSSITDSTNLNPISLGQLCEELHLTLDKTNKLTARILEISREKYLPAMQDFFNRQRIMQAYTLQMELSRAHQRAYEKANHDYMNGEALRKQATDLELS